MNRRNQKKCEIICRCNEVSKEVIEQAIRDGSHTLNEIFDATTAGVGPCGGTCRKKLAVMLNQYLEKGTFPDTFIGKNKKKRR